MVAAALWDGQEHALADLLVGKNPKYRRLIADLREFAPDRGQRRFQLLEGDVLDHLASSLPSGIGTISRSWSAGIQ